MDGPGAPTGPDLPFDLARELLEDRDIEEDAGDAELDHYTSQRSGEIDAFSVIAYEPGNSREYHETEQSLKKHEVLL